jgi:hypothetical protein
MKIKLKYCKGYSSTPQFNPRISSLKLPFLSKVTKINKIEKIYKKLFKIAGKTAIKKETKSKILGKEKEIVHEENNQTKFKIEDEKFFVPSQKYETSAVKREEKQGKNFETPSENREIIETQIDNFTRLEKLLEKYYPVIDNEDKIELGQLLNKLKNL